MLSYDKEKNKPILLNDEAVHLCLSFINDPLKAKQDMLDDDIHFEADDLFLEWMATNNPSPEQVDEFVLRMVEECSQTEDEDLPPLGEVLKEKLGFNEEEVVEESDKDKKVDIPWYDGDL